MDTICKHSYPTDLCGICNPPARTQVESIEEALEIFGQRIADPDFAARVRQVISIGTNVRYALTIKQGINGYIVGLTCTLEAPKRALGTFLRLS
jgi:hypothetical protein